MRRLLAVLSLFSLANLVFVQGSTACPLTGTEHHAAAKASASGHEGHDMAATGHELSQPVPDDGSPHAPACLTMGPCAVTVAIASSVNSAGVSQHAALVVATSDHLPPSAVIDPELPPPRA